MRYFKTNTDIRAIDKDQDFLIENDWIEISFEEMMDITNPPLTDEKIEAQRISLIKAKAKELIEETYPIYKQNNNLMSGVTADISNMNQYITNIRNISNEAEANGTALEDIAWK